MLDDNPIFIGGDGRSGTTLLNIILDCHPELSVATELHFAGEKIQNLGQYALDSIKLIRGGGKLKTGERAVHNPEWKPGIQFVLRTQRTGLTLDEIETGIIESRNATDSEISTFPDRCDLVQRLGRILRDNDEKSRWGFKIMREIRNPDKYAQQWPNCQVIHIIRDGRDVAASQMTEHSSWGYGEASKAAENWVKLIEESREKAKDVSYLEIKYEDLVLETRGCLETICEFLGVGFSESMLNHQKHDHRFYKTKVAHPSRKRTMQAVDNSAIGRFVRDFTEKQIHTFEDIAGDMLESLNYKLTNTRRVSP